MEGGGQGNGPTAPGNCGRHDGRRHEGALGLNGRCPQQSEAFSWCGRGALGEPWEWGGWAGSAGVCLELVAVCLRGPLGERPFPTLRRAGLVVSEGAGGGGGTLKSFISGKMYRIQQQKLCSV